MSALRSPRPRSEPSRATDPTGCDLALATPPAPSSFHGNRLWIQPVQRVRSEHEDFFAVAETVSVGIPVEGVGPNGRLLYVEEPIARELCGRTVLYSCLQRSINTFASRLRNRVFGRNYGLFDFATVFKIKVSSPGMLNCGAWSVSRVQIF